MKTLIKPSVHRWANWSHYLHSEKNSIEGHRGARRGRLARAHSNDDIWFVWRQRKQSRQLTSLVDDFIASKAAAAHWNRTRTHRGPSWNDVIAERFSVWAAVCDLLWDVTQKELIKCPFFFFLCSFSVFWLFDEWLSFWENPGCVTLNMSSLIMTWENIISFIHISYACCDSLLSSLQRH